MLGHQLITAVEAAAHKLCSAFGLFPVKIIWSDQIGTAGINDAGNMYLADVAPDATVSRALLNRYVGFVVHELLHRKYTDFNVRAAGAYVAALHNAVEDVWIERCAVRDGLTGNIHGLLSTLIDGMVNEALSAVSDWTDPGQYPFALAVEGRRYAVVKVPLAQGLAPIFDEASKRIDACLNSRDTLDVAEWVFRQLSIPEQDKPGKPGDKPGKPGQPGDDQPGDNPGNPGDNPGQRKVPASRKALAREVEPDCPEGSGSGGTYCRTHAMHRVDKPLRQGHTVFATAVPGGGKLRYEVKRLFADTGRCDWDTHRKTGALNVKALPSISSGATRVFKRRDEVEGVDSAVLILLDVSLSMFYERQTSDADPALIKAAVPTVAGLHQAVTAAGAECAVWAFGDYPVSLSPWGGSAAKLRDRLEHIDGYGQTNDGLAVRLCGDILLARDEARRVLFVVTDGAGDSDTTKDRVAALERCGITVIGVGIGVDVSGTYRQAVMVKDAADLNTISLKAIKTMV